MEFLHGSKLAAAIRDILAEDGARAAVAFWGKGSESWVMGKDVKLIANLKMGGTNPNAFEDILAEKRQRDDLHAKVYIGAGTAIVCSANASINGLALENSEQVGWLEAGMLVDDTMAIQTWFDNLWDEGSREINPADWLEAKRLWNLRSKWKPTLPTFEAFDATANRLPMVVWQDNSDTWTTNEDAVALATGLNGTEAQQRVDWGLEIVHPGDAECLSDRWVLIWTKTQTGSVSKRSDFWFSRMSEIVVKGGFSWDSDNEPRDVILAAETPPPFPFDPAEPTFRKAFSETISLQDYAVLRQDCDPAISWYKSREELTGQFWRAAQAHYLKLKIADNAKLEAA